MTINKTKQELVIEELLDAFNPIESEVIRMMGNRTIFQKVKEISQINPKNRKGNLFWDFLKESYTALMVSAVCRQIDTDTRSASLVNLLNRLLQADVTTVLTKDWYVGKYHNDDVMVSIGRCDFERHFGQKDFVDPDIIRADLEKLISTTSGIKRLRNKRIAHRDPLDNLVFGVSFRNLDIALETIRGITSKYYALLKQGSNNLTPTDQTDWQEIFTVPWMEKHNL